MSLRDLRLFPYTHSEGLWPACSCGRDPGIEKRVQKERSAEVQLVHEGREDMSTADHDPRGLGGELELMML